MGELLPHEFCIDRTMTHHEQQQQQQQQQPGAVAPPPPQQQRSGGGGGPKQRTLSDRSSAYSSDPNQTDRGSNVASPNYGGRGVHQSVGPPQQQQQRSPIVTTTTTSLGSYQRVAQQPASPQPQFVDATDDSVDYPAGLPQHQFLASPQADYPRQTATPINTIVLSNPKQPHGGDEPVKPAGPIHLTESGEVRESWDKKIDFLLSVIGFAVDLANIWRFPYLCFKNGGGVFLIPYVIMVVTAGVPLFYMELALGQYYRSGAITCWGKICPLFKGIGWCVVLSAFYVDFFYNVIISWAIRFFYESFTTRLPWATCNNTWNGACCYDLEMLRHEMDINNTYVPLHETFCQKGQLVRRFSMSYYDCMTDDLRERLFKGKCAMSDLSSSAEEYFRREFLGYHNDSSDKAQVAYNLDNLGPINYKNMAALACVYLICYFSLWKGIKMSGKVVWFTAVFPYVVLMMLFSYGLFLPGSTQGMRYYLLEPNLTKLYDGSVWMDAATQVFFSLGPGFGVLLAFSSYNEFHNNIYQDALVTSVVNCMTSFLSGFVIFTMLGYMSCRSGKPIKEVAVEGTGLVFVVYPEALSTMPLAPLWSLLFFLMLMTLGLDSSFGGSEAIITAVSDEFPILKKYRELFVGVLFSGYFLIGIVQCTRGGYFLEEWISFYACKYGLVVAVFIETIVVSWIYDLRRFKRDIKEMLGFEPGTYWCFCWAVFGPVFLAFNFVFGLLEGQMMPPIDGYEIPPYIQYLGIALAISSALSIPLLSIIQILLAPGRTLREKLKFTITPWKVTMDTKRKLKADAAANRNGPGDCMTLMAVEQAPPAVPPHRTPLHHHDARLTTTIPTGHNMIVTLQRTTDDIML